MSEGPPDSFLRITQPNEITHLHVRFCDRGFEGGLEGSHESVGGDPVQPSRQPSELQRVNNKSSLGNELTRSLSIRTRSTADVLVQSKTRPSNKLRAAAPRTTPITTSFPAEFSIVSII